jgi:O-antigen/teichoic acid export membrane protein
MQINIKQKIVTFFNNPGLMRYVKNTSWLLGEKILRLTIGLLVGIWVARYLGPEEFGDFNYALSFVAFFSIFATLGLDKVVVRELVKNKALTDKLMGTAFILKLIGSGIVLCLLYITVLFRVNEEQTNVFIFIIAGATIFQSFNVIDFYYQSKVLSRYVVYSNFISLLISSIVKIVLILNNVPLIFFVYVVLFDSIILMLGFVYFYYKTNHSIRSWCFDKQIAISLLQDSWPLILSGLVVTVYMKVDQIMIKQMLGSIQVGEYAAAARLSEAWYFIPVVICSSLFPAIINAKKISDKLYYERLQKLYDIMVWGSIVIIIPVTLSSEWLIALTYGSEYSRSAGVLVIHIWASVFVFLGVASSSWFIVENLQKYSFYRSLMGACLNIVLNFMLIPRYGIYGAAISTLVAQFIAVYFCNALHPKLRVTFKLQTNAILLPFRGRGLKL